MSAFVTEKERVCVYVIEYVCVYGLPQVVRAVWSSIDLEVEGQRGSVVPWGLGLHQHCSGLMETAQ